MINKRLIQLSTSVALTIGAVLSAPVIAAPWFSSLLPVLKRQTSVPILLPSSLPTVWQKYYSSGTVNKIGYFVALGKDKYCAARTNRSNDCGAVYIDGVNTAEVEAQNDWQDVKLAKGISAYFIPKGCHGERDCLSRAGLIWHYQEYIYSLSAPNADRATLVNMANSAIMVGPR